MPQIASGIRGLWREVLSLRWSPEVRVRGSKSVLPTRSTVDIRTQSNSLSRDFPRLPLRKYKSLSPCSNIKATLSPNSPRCRCSTSTTCTNNQLRRRGSHHETPLNSSGTRRRGSGSSLTRSFSFDLVSAELPGESRSWPIRVDTIYTCTVRV